MWENDFYIWNPTTGQTTPKTAQKYSYNPETGMWDTTQYKYDAPSGNYVPNVVSTTQNPNPSSDDTASTTTTTNNNGFFDTYYNAAISNSTSAAAMSGNAYVTANTAGGSAVSGDATAISNVINLLQSAGFDTGNMTNFSANIQGDVVGDLIIDPGTLGSATNAATTNNNLAVNAQQTGAVKNVIDLNAGTGTAVVDSNTQAGNAISGNANAVANVVNMINSIVGSGQSFMGNINIMGNFNGDILLPQDFLDSLLSSNAPVTTLDTSSITNNNVLADLTTNAAISNNVNAAATTGQANVSNNTTAGNATSGNANTNITVLNLTGSQVIGKNALLVFVNVLGHWVGMIMNAPGATSGVVGGGITENSSTTTNNASLTSKANYLIGNDINVRGHSGDAGVTNNTSAGNAQTGNATASVNLANMLNSSFSLSDWFGVLFINVFGSWNGSFGVNTAAGNLPASPEAIAEAAQNPANVKIFSFIAGGSDNKATLTSVAVDNSQSSGSNSSEQTKPAVLATTNDKGSSDNSGTAAARQMSWMVPFTAMVIGGTLLGTDKFFGRRRFSTMRFTRRGSVDFIEPLKSH
jgi:hypothetical protein